MPPVQQNELFQRSRLRLAAWYAGVMGIVLSLSGLGVYEAIAHSHWVTADRELESVAGTLHDSIERTLRKPGRLELASRQLLPNLCFIGEECPSDAALSGRHILSAVHQDNYYVRLLNRTGKPVAFAGIPLQELSLAAPEPVWQMLQDSQGNRYRQITLTLETLDHRAWGTLQVGRSLRDFDNYLAAVRWIMLIGLPLAMLAIGGASWWLAGRAMRPIYQAYRQVQQFTADAAHELRTPLAAVQATIESVLRLPRFSTGEARDTLVVVERQNQRLIRLVNDLLLLSRLDRQVVSQRRFCCLQDIISDIEEELAALAVTEQITLVAEVEVSKPLRVVGDEAQLYQLVFNLVSNAIQYTPAGGNVTITLGRQDTQAVIQVHDTGVGIAPEHQTKIFDRFYRASDDRSRLTGGSGLGLSIARAIAQAHGGSIQVQSELGKGSLFTVQLPVNTSFAPMHKKMKSA